MLEGFLCKKILDTSFGALRDIASRILKQADCDLIASKQRLEDSLTIHLRSIENWSAEISFNDLKKSKLTSDVFIDLDLFVYPRQVRMSSDEEIETIPLHNIFDASTNHIILLGHPGSGKTTSMKYLCRLLLHDDRFQPERFAFPILIRFRDLNDIKISPDTLLISDQIYNLLGLNIHWPQELNKDEAFSERKSIKEKFVISVLEELKVLLIMDGFDELALGIRRDIVIKEVIKLTTHLNQCTLIVTSRTGDFKYQIENAVPYEISPLTDEQIKVFSKKWLNSEEEAFAFLNKIHSTPFADTTIRPLTLAHLCAIYERTKDIPKKPKSVYKKIVHLLLEEWDQQWGIRRESRYAHFEVDRKYDFLCHVAYYITTSLQMTTFSIQHLMTVYENIYAEYGLEKKEIRQVVSEIETHTGLMLQSGYEQLEFAHRSLQEFLTAEYLVRLPAIPDIPAIVSRLPNEFAIAIAISSSSSDYFGELVLGRFLEHRLSGVFLRAFLSRLLIEKPEFKASIKLDLALVLLYSKYVEANLPSLSESDPVYDELKKVLDLLRNNSMDIILSGYKTDDIHQMSDGDHIIQLISRSKEIAVYIPHEFGILRKYFPKVIYVRMSFINRFLHKGIEDLNEER